MFVDDTPKYRQTYMGATEETHEDILFDYHMKRQQQFVTRMRPGHQVSGYFEWTLVNLSCLFICMIVFLKYSANYIKDS